MHKKTNSFRSCILCFAMVLLLCIRFSTTVIAAESYPDFTPYTQNTDSGYGIYIDDRAKLLSETEKQQLSEIMEKIAAYGNVAFVSILENPYPSTQDYADNYYYEHFASDSGTLFLIDMEERVIFIHSNGEIYETITTAYANSITSNTYSYASEGDYYTCAAMSFEQIYTLLDGRAIAQPMKYISNALLAIALALFTNFFIVMLCSRSKKANDAQIINSIYSKTEIHNPTSRFLHQSRHYSPQNSGNTASHSSSGGGGGGGSHGGGGGHSF